MTDGWMDGQDGVDWIQWTGLWDMEIFDGNDKNG